MDKLEIEPTEQQVLTRLLDEIEDGFESLESAEALRNYTVLAHQMPSRIRLALNAFRLERMSGVLCISGYVVDQDRIGRTPGHWRDRPTPSTTRREELLLILFSSLLGNPFGWATQQDGRLIHDVLPIKGHENEQLGSSSESLLTWHTEDCFHPLRGDFLSFACLRNPYAAATTVGYVESLDLSEATKDILFQERFCIRPDESHLAKNNSASSVISSVISSATSTSTTFTEIEKMQRDPDRVAVLFGDPAQPYIRADPYFMSIDPDDHEAQHALDHLIKEMDAHMFDLRLESGDFCFLDNFRVVHGRKPFKARHDGTDRWLKRLNVACDLRKSRAARLSVSTRSIN